MTFRLPNLNRFEDKLLSSSFAIVPNFSTLPHVRGASIKKDLQGFLKIQISPTLQSFE